jgi:hypothetical protein
MTWFKVDDNYWSHPKVMFQSLEASGLWVRAASWTANHLTDGRIPVKVAHMIIPKRPRAIDALADELEASGMWLRDGDAWVFHDWQEYQPTRAKVEEERAQARSRMRRVRANTHRTFGDGSEGVRQPRPDPSRPDPTRPTTQPPHG